MRRLRGGGVTLALLLSLAGQGLAAEPQDAAGRTASSSGSWWSGWFGSRERPDEKKPGSAAEKASAPAAPADTAVTIRQREYDTYWRRTGVCNRLKLLAWQAGDEEQVRRVEELEDRIWAVYQQRIAKLPGGVSAQDDVSLEQNLNTLGRKPVLFSSDRVGTEGSRAGLFGGGNK